MLGRVCWFTDAYLLLLSLFADQIGDEGYTEKADEIDGRKEEERLENRTAVGVVGLLSSTDQPSSRLPAMVVVRSRPGVGESPEQPVDRWRRGQLALLHRRDGRQAPALSSMEASSSSGIVHGDVICFVADGLGDGLVDGLGDGLDEGTERRMEDLFLFNVLVVAIGRIDGKWQEEEAQRLHFLIAIVDDEDEAHVFVGRSMTWGHLYSILSALQATERD